MSLITFRVVTVVLHCSDAEVFRFNRFHR